MFPLTEFIIKKLKVADIRSARRPLFKLLSQTSQNHNKIYRTIDKLLQTGVASPHIQKTLLMDLFEVSEQDFHELILSNEAALKARYYADMFHLLGCHIHVEVSPSALGGGRLFAPLYLIRLHHTFPNLPRSQKIACVRERIIEYLETKRRALPGFQTILYFDCIFGIDKRWRFDSKGRLVDENPPLYTGSIERCLIGNKHVRFK